VRKHRSRPFVPAQLGEERKLEADPAAQPASTAVRANADVRRQLVPADARTEHGDFIESARQAADQIERLGEHRMVGVDRLRDED
jgi:hypothetical protein